MTLRSPRERAIQTIAFELGGLLMVAPAYALFFGATGAESLLLIAALSAAILIWTPLFNTAFDWADLRLIGRLASDRPHGLRIVHAVLHEAGSVVVTLPIILALTDLSLLHALTLDVGLTLFYAGYAYLFHLGYDRLRPVRPVRPAGSAQPQSGAPAAVSQVLPPRSG